MSGERAVTEIVERRRKGPAMALVAAVLLWSAAATGEGWRWQGVERIVAISDVHGAAGPMLKVLRHAQVIDADNAWSADAAHLVVTGDLLDHGPESRLAMDILMRLEREAAAAGGRVHVLLGNHEAMNLVGDLRYVSAAEYAAFAEEESPSDRERAYAAFRASRGGELDESALEREFERRAPRGFFGHRKAFAPDGRYGEWLLEKPLIVVINDTAFVHGGLSPLVTKLGLDGVNGELRSQLQEYASLLATLTAAGVLDATDNFYEHPEVLAALPDDPDRPADIESAIQAARKLAGAAIHDPASPLWYRGNVGCSPLIEAAKLTAALERLQAARVVIGHTPTPTRGVLQRLDGRVVEIDTGMLNAAYGGRAHALIIDDSRLAAVDEDGLREIPQPHPDQSATRSGPESADGIQRILETGELVSSTAGERGGKVVEVTDGTRRLTARFDENPRKGIAPELAAYRLDRLLGLDMVPVTIARTIDGKAGSLQLLAAATENEATRAASGRGVAAWCPLPEQWHAMYLFDALAGNGDRSPDNMQYSPGSWHLVLTGHGKAFGTRSARPRYLQGVDLQPDAAWATALSALSDERLQRALGDILDQPRLRALGKRRDELLAAADDAQPAAGR